MATTYAENYHRLASLLVDVGTAVLRRLFLHYVMTSAFPSVPQFLVSKKLDIDRIHKRKILGGYQMKTLFPGGSTVADVKHWDISLLSALLINITPISKREEGEIPQLRSLRNQIYGHVSSVSLTDTELTKFWNTAHSSITVLATACHDTVFLTEINALIDDIKDGSLSIGASVEVLNAWYQRDHDLEASLTAMEDKLEKIQTSLKGIEEMKRSTDPVFENMKRHSRILIQETLKQPFVKTGQYRETVRVLNETGNVVIAGKPGEGKTKLALQIAHLLASDPERCLVLYAANQWYHVDVNQVDVIILDDVFGKHSADQGAVIDWLPILENLQTFVKSGHVKLILTSRDNILRECENLVTEIDVMKRTVSLSSEELTQTEKKEILGGLLDHHHRDKSLIDISKCCDSYKAPLGFPYSCFLFAADEKLFLEKEKFFRRPQAFFREVIAGLEKRHKAAFLFLFYKQGHCHERDLKLRHSDMENVKLKDFCAELVGLSKQDLTFHTIREAFVSLNGIYITYIDKSYEFSHATIYECIAFVHGDSFPEEVIANSTWNFLESCMTTDQSDCDFKLVVKIDHYDVLVERIIDGTSPAHGTSRMFSLRCHQFVQCNEFCTLFFEELSKHGSLEEFLTREEQNGFGGFLHRCVRLDGYDQGHLIDSLMPFIECGNDCSKNCWKCMVKTDALRAACLGGKQDIFTYLLKSGAQIVPNCLSDSCSNGNADLIRDVVEELKKTEQFDPMAVQASKAIIFAFKDPASRDLYDYLKQEGIRITSMAFNMLCQDNKTDTYLLERAVDEMKRDATWVAEDAFHTYSLSFLINSNVDGYNFLKTLVPYVSTHSLIQAVKTNNIDVVRLVVSDLKKQHHWWPSGKRRRTIDTEILNAPPNTWANMAEALFEARRVEDSSILEYLESEGMQINMRMLEPVVNSKDVDLEKVLISELKENGKWEPYSEEAGKALLAALKQSTESFERLKTEGLNFSMDNLPEVLMSGELGLVVQVVEELKEINMWRTDHPMTLAFLTHALRCEDPTIFEYLKDSGLRITTMTIMGEVLTGSVDYVKKCIDIMKAANEWNASDPFLTTCLTLTKLMKPEMHNLLVQEGVGICSANLLELIKAKSLMAVHTINDLEKIGAWHPNDDNHIKNAFVYVLRLYFVVMYTIFVKKGMRVTSWHLAIIMENAKSLIYSTGLCYKKPIIGVPSLAALSAVPVAKAVIEYAADHNYRLVAGACIHSLEESGINLNESPNFLNALKIACRKSCPSMYNIMADTDLKPPPLMCIEALIGSIYERLGESTTTHSNVPNTASKVSTDAVSRDVEPKETTMDADASKNVNVQQNTEIADTTGSKVNERQAGSNMNGPADSNKVHHAEFVECSTDNKSLNARICFILEQKKGTLLSLALRVVSRCASGALQVEEASIKTKETI